jgi:hypothetical protein
MFCIYCGAPNPNDASFCSTCGKAIGASANPPVHTEIPQRVLSSTQGSGDSRPQAWPPMSLPAQPPPQPQTKYQPAAGRSKIGLWILVGFAACLVIVIAVALGFRQNQASSGTETPAANSASNTPPATARATDNRPAADSVPVQAPPPPAAAPQNPIVGEWKTTTLIGDTLLNFTGDGRYTIKSALVSDAGVYVFSSGDGTLRLQPNALFSHDIVIWNCQLSKDSMSVVDPDGAGHVYTRVQQ